MSIGDFPEGLSQAILEGRLSVGRLGVGAGAARGKRAHARGVSGRWGRRGASGRATPASGAAAVRGDIDV